MSAHRWFRCKRDGLNALKHFHRFTLLAALLRLVFVLQERPFAGPCRSGYKAEKNDDGGLGLDYAFIKDGVRARKESVNTDPSSALCSSSS
ncbi:hypothetical protein V5799_013178 [Amblyomma americanum]|uniref:Secreted protein n=1 Tax=Amblyomma americanum TaxID=6943 RepID=A0AAQ4E6L2_AMBAM